MPPKRKREDNPNEIVPQAKKAKLEEKDEVSSDLSKPQSVNNAKKQLSKKKKINLNLPLHPLNKPLPTVFDVIENGEGQEADAAEPFSKDELEIIKISQTIREKPNWLTKFFDDHIRRKWKSEALDQGADDVIVNYVFNELEQYYAFSIEGNIEMATVEGVYQSDELIPKEVKAAFMEQVAVLENVNDADKDWHPGSNEQVLDLVHPSLHCYVSGVTKVTRKQLPWSQFVGAGHISAIPKEPNAHPGRSAQYQWLPSEFNVDEDGKVKIASYINNLHPEIHADLYTSLASIFEEFVPLFNKVMTDVIHPRQPRFKPTDYHWNEDTEEYELKDVPVFKPIPPPHNVVNLNGRELQVIVKLANIVLTPEDPKYNGGVWHVEGMTNERIVATGIYYYASENISESRLEFRQAVKMPDLDLVAERGEKPTMASAVYGISRGSPGNQKLGSIVTKEDRCIVFPNLYQHKVAPFKLVNPTKPGVRKILVFFLVDPVTPVLSTANVPPQQEEWIKMEIGKRVGTRFEDLPNELMQEILKKVDFGMTLDKAKQYRLELMAERKRYVQRSTETFERVLRHSEDSDEDDEDDDDDDEDDYNLCEH